MPLSWNEIRSRALAFSKEWANETSEDAEAKAFWDGFFNIFGVTRRRVASFEEPVKKSDGKGGYIDVLWKGVLLVEHKSRGKDLDRATKQAFDYFPGLKERDLPRYVVVSDFARFRLHDLDAGTEHDFDLADLHRNVKLFGFMAGYQSRSFGKEAAVNIRAAEKLGKLHDLLKASGYEGHQLEVLLVRLLFILFAEDTGIFERRQFTDWIEQRTSDDGADFGSLLNTLFEVLDTPPEKRQKSLDEQLAGFPHVNGKLFAENLRFFPLRRTGELNVTFNTSNARQHHHIPTSRSNETMPAGVFVAAFPHARKREGTTGHRKRKDRTPPKGGCPLSLRVSCPLCPFAIRARATTSRHVAAMMRRLAQLSRCNKSTDSTECANLDYPCRLQQQETAMLDLLETLRLCVAAQAKEPGNPGTDAELDALLDDRIFAIIEVLIERYDECGELARACIARAARSHP